MSSAAMTSPFRRRRAASRLPALGGRVASALVDLSGLAALLGLWALGGWLIARNPATAAFAALAPAPALRRLYEMLVDGSAFAAAGPSLARIAGGLAIAFALGAPIGVLVGRSALFRKATHLPFQLLRMVSPLAWMPIAILAFPTWNAAIVFLIFAASIWPIIFSTAHGLRKLDPDWFRLAQNLGAGRLQILTAVVVPAAAQDVLTGLRLALGVAWIVLAPAEYLGVTSGLGYAINDARDTLDYDRLAATVVLIGLIGFFLDALIVAAIARVSWTHQD
ncbi:ABC transporter permease [Methylocystis parvus]|uniref:ABC transporter permease n=1 Tax=Methylocystis parvus TaxID=134 RepID=A0A6B8M525_9HYPH|nr:ABC transporter permease [Methylocystis parvus]QGM97498.1 ABC transporter permease [Methylocystis parvus]WBJ98580.1 ABC transporter permease [Methylocystis parvus OBBP]